MWRKILAIRYLISMRTVSADHSQGNEALLGEHAGKQSWMCINVAAIVYHQIEQWMDFFHFE